MKPNLFKFATSELSQDAFFCWMMSWADKQNQKESPELHNLGIEFLNSIYLKSGLEVPISYSLSDVSKQEAGIDFCCMVNDDTVIYFEDKAGSKQHSDQLRRYREYIEKKWPAATYNLIPVYLQTGDQSDYEDVKKQGYLTFSRSDILEILESASGILARSKSDILNDFGSRLREIEDNIQSYAILPLVKWTWDSWQGFYIRIQKELKDGRWEYVANASGGFLGFWWCFQELAKCKNYLQLEHELLCFKISVHDQKDCVELRNYWNKKILEKDSEFELKIKKPNKFGYGRTMTVAVYDRDYRCVNIDGLINIPDTIIQIKKAEQLLISCVSAASQEA